MARMTYLPEEDDSANAADRERPPVTHRPVDPAQTAAEQARVPQNQLAPDPHAVDRDDPAEAESGAQKKARRRSVKK